MLENLTHMAVLVQILAGLGLVTALVAFAKQSIERYRWRRFKTLVVKWLEEIRESEESHPHELGLEDWKVRCERLLMTARFSPLEIQQLLETAVVVAKGIVSEKFFV